MIARVYCLARPGDKVEVLDRTTDERVLPENVEWEKILTNVEWKKCRDGLTIYKEINLGEICN